MIPPPDCSVREDDPRVDVPSYQDEYRGGYEPDWEDLAYDLAREREFEESVSYIRESERQLHASTKPNRQLREISKESKSLGGELLDVHHYDLENICFDVSEDLENYVTVPRNGVPRTPTRKDKRRIKGNLRRHLRRNFGILAKRGCSPRKVKGYEDGSSATVVAAM
jgi:hypothetical protein